jgi:hypothetical protein
MIRLFLAHFKRLEGLFDFLSGATCIARREEPNSKKQIPKYLGLPLLELGSWNLVFRTGWRWLGRRRSRDDPH